MVLQARALLFGELAGLGILVVGDADLVLGLGERLALLGRALADRLRSRAA